MTKVARKNLVLFVFFLLSTSCTMNYSIDDMNAKSPVESINNNVEYSNKIYIDTTELTLVEGSVAIINVAVNPIRSVDTKIQLSLTSPNANYIRFNPIPIQITIPAGLTSKSVILTSIDDSFVQNQEVWTFKVAPLESTIKSDPGELIITLNDNDGGFIPNAPPSTPVPKILSEINPYPVAFNGIAFNNKFIYKGADAGNGYELWITDGTALGTHLLKDINPGLPSSSPGGFYVNENKTFVFFVAETANEGVELWRTDGTPEGTILLRDFIPGTGYGTIAIGETKGDQIFFTATEPTTSSEVFVSDGTIAGTHVLKDIIPGATVNSLFDVSFFKFNNEIYFSYNDSTLFESAIWKTDGTEAGTVKITNALSTGQPLHYFGNYDHTLNFNGKMYFSTETAFYGVEIYYTDGTASGTKLLKDFYTTSLGDSYAYMTGDIFNSKALINVQYDDNTNPGIWVTDGTTAGTTKILLSVNLNIGLPSIGTVNEKLIFAGRNPTTGEVEPWVSDGTAAGSFMLKDINPGNEPTGLPKSSGPGLGYRLGNKLVFSATSTDEGTELWVTDGTSAGTLLLKDIIPGSLSSYPSNFVILNNKLYFTAYSFDYGNELWVTDGTPAGTTLYKDVIPGTISSGPISLSKLNETSFVFAAYNTTAHFGTLYLADVISNSITSISHALMDSVGSSTTFFKYFNGHVYFNAKDASNGNPLWTTDGSAENTQKLIDLFPNSACLLIGNLMEINSSIMFTAFDENGTELRISDGTAAGTTLVKDIYAGSYSATAVSTAFTFTSDRSKAYFAATDTNGSELWVTNGTSAGTYMVKDLYTGSTAMGPNSSSPASIYLIPGTNEVIFVAFKAADSKRYVFVSDGTSAGTVEITGFGTYSAEQIIETNDSFIISVVDGSVIRLYAYDKVTKTVTLLNTGYNTDRIPYSSSKTYIPRLNKLFFSTSTTDGKTHKIWCTDGTVAGTTVIKNLSTSSYSSNMLNNVKDNGSTVLLPYSNSTSVNRGELYITDGTLAGTVSIKTFEYPISLIMTHNSLTYFSAQTTTEGQELWRTDGTTAGTFLVKDIYAGSASSNPYNFTVLNNQVYFTASDKDHGNELWRTDGQTAGTELVYDINPGPLSSSPTNLNVIGGTLYFNAIKILSGNEIWTYTP